LGEVTDARFYLHPHPSWAKNKKVPGLEPSARPTKNHGETRVGHLLVSLTVAQVRMPQTPIKYPENHLTTQKLHNLVSFFQNPL
jgi:hypothetical protein